MVPATDGLAQTSWGLSPVTRLNFNGFVRVPSFRLRDEWLAFADWRGSGYLGPRELAALFAASLPVPQVCARSETHVALQCVADQMVRSGVGDVLRVSDLRSSILPYLEKRASAVTETTRVRNQPSQKEGEKVTSKFLAAQMLERGLEMQIE